MLEKKGLMNPVVRDETKKEQGIGGEENCSNGIAS